MKLKLESKDRVFVLTISESIAPDDIPVLRAGIANLFTEGKNPLILDLTPASFEPAARARASEFMAAGGAAGAILLVASTDAELAAAPSLQGCMDILNAPFAKLLAQEAQLKSRVSLAKTQKTEVEQRLVATAALGDDIRKLKRELGGLKKLEARLEAQLRTQLGHRRAPLGADPARDGLLDTRDVLRRVFAPTGLIKERAEA